LVNSVELRVPVYGLDRRLLLPEKTLLSPDTLEALVASNKDDYGEALPLLQYGTVHKDLLQLLTKDPYNAIFNTPEKTRIVLHFMEQSRVIKPLLGMLDTFKETAQETYQHILRVTALSAFISWFLLDSDEEVSLTVLSAAFHDFGKTCISPDVLSKSDPLTRLERKGLEHHTLAGYVLISYYLKRTGTLAARVARDHHERQDGSGYPLGISLKDRVVEIVAVSDIYDALVSNRPYRPTAYENRRALEEITEMAANGKIGWEIVKELISLHRSDRPKNGECVVSGEKRSVSPEGNVYGVVLDDEP
jgi:HD-GYP domain-containing protein (c-di-GMP phosphodiesterase class II)